MAEDFSGSGTHCSDYARCKLRYTRHLMLSGTYKSLWCTYQQIKPLFTEKLYDIFAVHQDKDFVSFGGFAGRCYLVVIRDLALKHNGILQEHSIQGHVMPSCESTGFFRENDGLWVTDHTVERFTAEQFERVNQAFDEIEDFNYPALLANQA